MKEEKMMENEIVLFETEDMQLRKEENLMELIIKIHKNAFFINHIPLN